MDIEENSAPVPAWMQALENKRKRVHRLAHEIGAGSPCLTCQEGCPGLDLHFWRKLCRNCKCKKEDHDVIDDSGYEQFELLLGTSHTKVKRGCAFLNIQEKENGKVEEEESRAEKVAFDWIPPDVSADLAAEYMAALPTGKLPISGSDGALYRRQQLERQLPLHDLDAEQCHQLTPAEVDRLKEYLENLRQNVVGQGRIAKLPMHTSQSADSLRLPSVYNTVPKPFQINHAETKNYLTGEEGPLPSSTGKAAPAVSLKPPSAFLPKDRISPIPRVIDRSSSPNYASEEPSSLGKNTVPGDVAYSSVADRGNVFGVTLTPPRSRSSAQASPTRSAAYRRDASPSYLDKTAPQVDVSHSSSLPHQQHSHSYSAQGDDTKNHPNPGSSHSPINSRGSSPSRVDKNQVGLSHSSSLAEKQQTYPYAAQDEEGRKILSSLPGSRGASPRFLDRNPAPPVGVAHSSSLPHHQYLPCSGSHVNSRDPSPSYVDRNRSPQIGVVHSTSLPGHQHTSPFSAHSDGTLHPGSYSSPVNSRGPSPTIQEYIGQPHLDVSSSSNVPGNYYNPTQGRNSNSASPRSSSPSYDPAALDGSHIPADSEPFQNRKPSGISNRFNSQPIGGRVLRDHVPKLYASEATPPGGMWVPVDYLEGPKSKPVDGKLLREPVLGCLATSTIVPEALKVLPPSSIKGLRIDDTYGYNQNQSNPPAEDIHPQPTPSDTANTQPVTQNLMQLKSAPHSDAMYARVTAHSPSNFELDPQDTLSPQVAALSVDVPAENYPPQIPSEPTHTNIEQIPQILLSCVHCQETVLPGEVVVCADRAGPDFVWHPKCFVCDTCDELLVDLVYFYSKGRVFCGRHFANLLDIPRCKACDELIFVREYTVAEGEAFHVKHFCCFECDEPLADKQYVPHNGHPVCLDCFERKYGKKCHTCGLVIDVGKQRMGLKDLNWHLDPACFKCFNCHKSLIGGRLLLNQQQPYCSKECVLQVKEAAV